MEAGMIGESLRLMLIGMSIVFAFLMLLVVCLRGMSWLAARIAPAELQDAPVGAMAGGAGAAPDDADVVAVIAAAVARYRARHPG
ncbi:MULTISPECIES: OadG family protein [Thiorhodovibrio]|uniref:OadG family protein n=1 Tax=Thiorhodovibrio TaxID=61593 RepID=UPI001911F1CA|nr:MULTISPECIES: OadG family protein [Thiorhodovibrio]MBK5969558.1 hypothetical protein [Thiorhodovibrio winogradskyi]WPL13943.1 oxaloacetate decarboxylase subunit gamma [Thiorhodovibrio litoralis]